MTYIPILGSQIHIEHSMYGNKKPYVLRISISDQLNVVLSTQTTTQNKDWVSNSEIPVNFHPQKKYQLFIEDVDYSADGSSHYIEYKWEAWDIEDGLFIDKHLPIYSSPTWPDSIIVWYKGTIVGECIRKWTYVTYGTKDQCNGFFRWEEFAYYEPNCIHLVVSPELSIPINWYRERLWNIEEWKRYIFECQFGYDGWWGDPGYPQYAEYLYVSGLITDTDFDPSK
jgi:hypothetical protein